MTRLGAVGLLALALLACAPAAPVDAPEAPRAVVATREAAYRQAGGLEAAPGDTLRYALTWTAGARATGYRVTTTATGTGWSGMLTNVATTGLSMAFVPVNTTAWDSVTFSACVTSVNGSKTSAPKCVTWPLIRSPGAPGTVTVDSSLVIATLLIYPEAATTEVNVPVKLCPYFVALDGLARLVDGYNGAFCRKMYDDSVPVAMRLPGYPIQYEVATTVHEWRGLKLAARSPRDQLAHEMFKGPFT